MAITVPVDIDLQIKKAIEDSNELVSGINKSLMKIDSQAKKTGSAVQAIAFVEIARAAVDFARVVGGSVVDALGAVISEAAEAQKVSVELATALKLSGDFSDEAVSSFEDLAEELANISKFDDDLILSQIKVAKQFNITNNEARKLIRAAVELSALTGKDLNSSVLELGKTLDGTAGRLSETVAGMRQLTPSALASGAAIDLILKRFSGTSAASVDNFTGQLLMMDKAFNNLKKNLGAGFVEDGPLKSVFSEITKVITSFSDIIKENQDVIVEFAKFGIRLLVKAFGTVVNVVAFVDKALIPLRIAFGIAAAAVQLFGEALYDLSQGNFSNLKNSLNPLKAIENQAAKLNEQLRFSGGIYNSIDTAIGAILNSLDEETKTQKKITKEKLNQNEIDLKSQRIAAALKEQREAFQEKISKFGMTQLQQIELERQAALKKNDELYSDSVQKQKNIAKITAEFNKKEKEQRLKDQDEIFNRIKSASSNFVDFIARGDRSGLSGGQIAGAGGIGLLSQALSGRQGAVGLTSQIAETAGTIGLGLPGLGTLVGLLAQPKEIIKAQVEAFAEALPEIIDAIVEAIPVVIEAIANKADRIALALAKSMPLVAIALSKSVVEGARRFVSEILRGAGEFIGKILEGAGRFIEELANKIGEALQRLIDNLNPVKGIGNGVGSQLGSISGNGIGGSIGNFLNPVGAVAGRGVQAVADTVSNFLGFGKTGGFTGGGFTSSAIAGGGGNQQAAVVKVQIGQRDLATAILDLNRQGFRT